MFAKITGKPFQYEYCWNILKMERKWTGNLTSNKRAKMHSTGSPAESAHVESCYSTPYLGMTLNPRPLPTSIGHWAERLRRNNLKTKRSKPMLKDH